MDDYSRVTCINNALITTTLLPSIFYIRIKYCNRENFRLLVFSTDFYVLGRLEHYLTIFYKNVSQ